MERRKPGKNTVGIDWKWDISSELMIYEIRMHVYMYVHIHAFICTHLLALSIKWV